MAGQPAYTVRVSPKANGGLLGGAELAWDAANGTPLRAAVYASGDSSPVLELKATDVTFGAVPDSVFEVTPPPGAKVVNLSPLEGGAEEGEGAREAAPVTGLEAVQRQTLLPGQRPRQPCRAAPRRGAADLQRQGRRGRSSPTARASAASRCSSSQRASRAPAAPATVAGQLPASSKVSINGVQGEELDTALGTVLRFSRGGVDYVVIGSVPPAAAEAAARAL